MRAQRHAVAIILMALIAGLTLLLPTSGAEASKVSKADKRMAGKVIKASVISGQRLRKLRFAPDKFPEYQRQLVCLQRAIAPLEDEQFLNQEQGLIVAFTLLPAIIGDGLYGVVKDNRLALDREQQLLVAKSERLQQVRKNRRQRHMAAGLRAQGLQISLLRAYAQWINIDFCQLEQSLIAEQGYSSADDYLRVMQQWAAGWVSRDIPADLSRRLNIRERRVGIGERRAKRALRQTLPRRAGKFTLAIDALFWASGKSWEQIDLPQESQNALRAAGLFNNLSSDQRRAMASEALVWHSLPGLGN
jgi:hypothetical protein